MENLELMKAGDVRRMTDKGIFNRANDQLEKISKDIYLAAQNGDYYITVDGYLHKSVASLLKKYGYSVTSGSQYNEIFTKIGW